jgi:hypothetical protein
MIRCIFFGFSLLILFLLANRSFAEVTRIQILSQGPYAGGKAFGAVGPYVRVAGRFYGELDPTHPANRNIADIRIAQRNARGKVEYSADFEILRPADPFKGNGTLVYDVNNRGDKMILRQLNDAPPGNALDTPESAGDGFLMRQGFSVVWSGWIAGLPRAPHVLGAAQPLRLEVPRVPGIEQAVWDEFVFDDAGQSEARLTFSAATLVKAAARLTVRERNDAPPVAFAPAAWEFLDDGAIRLAPPGTPFRAGALYQFTYRARNPPVAGIGYAATRDWIGFLRYQQQDSAGTANPLALGGRHNIAVALAHGSSQGGGFLRGMLYRGFNETEDLRMVFEGVNPHNASARLYLNYRFAQPDRAHGMGHGFLGYPDVAFPYAYEKLRDPKSRKEDGLLERCRERDNCPKVLQTVTSTQYWQGAHSLNTTDGAGERDIALSANVRIYHFAGTQHALSTAMPNGACAMPASGAPNAAVDARPALRALLLALDRWVKGGAPPPESVYPKIADGTLVPASALKWPAPPASGFSAGFSAGFSSGFSFTAPRSPNPLAQFDYGARIAEGIIDTVPPAPHPFRYPVLVPQVDADGNEVAGLRLPEQAVPAATTTGWSLRSAEAGAAGELCYLVGMALPFARSAAEREAAKDPRPSLAERYQDRSGFLARIRTAAQELQRRGFYLEEDVEKTVNRASRAW